MVYHGVPWFTMVYRFSTLLEPVNALLHWRLHRSVRNRGHPSPSDKRTAHRRCASAPLKLGPTGSDWVQWMIFVDLTGIYWVYLSILSILEYFGDFSWVSVLQNDVPANIELWVISDDGSREINGLFTCRSFEGDLWTAVSQKVATKNHPMSILTIY